MSLAQFERDLQRETDELVQETIPQAIDNLVLELRQSAEDHTHRGVTGEQTRLKGFGAIHESWMAAPVVEPKRKVGGDAASREALADARPGDSRFVYSNDPRAYWFEFGTVKMAPSPAMQPALQAVGSKVVRV